MEATDALATLRTILELGWPAIVMIAIVIVYRENKRRTDEIIANLTTRAESAERRNEILLGLLIDRTRNGIKMPSVGEMKDPDGLLRG